MSERKTIPGRTVGITVIDSMMGTGKSTWIIDHMNETYAQVFDDGFQGDLPKYVVVVPSLSEVDRFTAACPALDFRDPQPIEGRKLWGLETLLKEGANIVTTHALFTMITPETTRLFQEQGYTLVIDEVLTTVDMFGGLSKKDRDALFNSGYVWVEPETKKLRWNDRDHGDYQGRFDDIRKLCQIGSLIYYRESVLIWEFPSEFLEAFQDVWVLTYMFEGSPMSAYLRAERFRYLLMAVEDGELIPLDDVNEEQQKEKLRELIAVYEGPMNNIGTSTGKANPLSSSWFKRADEGALKKLRASTENFFKKVACSGAADNMWTVYKPQVSKVKGARYAKQWVANNAKATNDFIDKQSLAYLCNIFHLPMIREYFEDRAIDVHEDLFALSEMIQWIWRSQIRRGDPITVFIPSDRMRSLLMTWLNSTNTVELMKGGQKATRRAA